MDSELLRDPIVIAGLAIGLAMKAFDLVKTSKHRRSQLNGDNPVVRALQDEGRLNRADASEREVRIVACLTSHDGRCDQRMRDHALDVHRTVDQAITAARVPRV